MKNGLYRTHLELVRESTSSMNIMEGFCSLQYKTQFCIIVGTIGTGTLHLRGQCCEI